MKVFYILILLFVCPYIVGAQSICFKLDSAECYRIPWQVKSVINIHKNELIRGETFSNLLIKETVKDKKALEYLTEVNLENASLLNETMKKIDAIDARAVIVIHYSNKLSDTIVFNSRAGYFYRDKLYLANTKLLLWLMEYLPLSQSNTEFLKEEDVSKLKKEHRFMTETIRE